MKYCSINSSLKNLTKKWATSPSFKPLRSLLQGQGSILCYHKVTESEHSIHGFNPEAYLAVRLDNFEQQMHYLSKSGNASTLDELIKDLCANKITKHRICVTFDDGYKDNLILALPILEKYSIPATIFIAPSLTNKEAALWWEELGSLIKFNKSIEFNFRNQTQQYQTETIEQKYKTHLSLNLLFKSITLQEQEEILTQLRSNFDSDFKADNLLLNWDEIRKLAEHPLITIGCHSLKHPILSKETSDCVQAEISGSKNYLENYLHRDIDFFAYPVGGKNEASLREFDIAKSCQLKAGLTTRSGHIFAQHRDYLMSLPRITPNYQDDLLGFLWKISGVSAFLENNFRRFTTD